MSVNPPEGTLTIENSHLDVKGNVSAVALKLGTLRLTPSYGLDAVANVSNSTTHTLELSNATTGLVTTSNIAVGGELTVSGNATVSSNLTVSGNATVSSNVVVGKDLVVTGNATVSSNLAVTGNATVSSNLTVTGDATMSSNLEVGTANLFVNTTTGRVGIGVSNPSTKLHIHSGDVGIDRDQKFDFGAGYSANWYIKQKSADNKIYFGRTGGSENGLVIDTVGYVGIGTNNPLAPLDIPSSKYGTIDVDDVNDGRYLTWNGIGTLNNQIDAYVSINADGGGVVAHAFWAGYNIQFLSDRRIKKDIKEIDDESALQKFRLLKPSKYKYIEPLLSGRTDKEVYGFIAQEVAEVLPEGVSNDGTGSEGTNQGHIPNIMSMCRIESQSISSDAYEILNTEQKSDYIKTNNTYTRHVATITKTIDLSTFNVNSSTATYEITEQTKTTGAFDKNSDGKYHPLIFYSKDLKTIRVDVVRVIDDSSFVVDTNFLNVDKFKDDELLLYGQKPDDFYRLNKDAIFTLAAAALQEVDRQLQAEKTKVTTLETQVADLLARVQTLESAVSK
jgi:cytoskeletal protein CcmA (bactofilin family)